MVSSGGGCSVAGEEGILAVDGISSGMLCACGLSIAGLCVRGSGSEPLLKDAARFGISEMLLQPWKTAARAATSIHTLTRRFKAAASRSAVDLGNSRCIGHRDEAHLQQ